MLNHFTRRLTDIKGQLGYMNYTVPNWVQQARAMVASAGSTATRDGFLLAVLTSPEATLTVVPALGAKVLSLVDRRSGREWRPPRTWRDRHGR